MADQEHVHGPECEHEHEHEEQIVTMVDDEGNTMDFAVVDVVDIHGKTYALLAPADEEENEEEANVLLMRVENDTLVPIEDEQEFNHVVSHLEGHAHQ